MMDVQYINKIYLEGTVASEMYDVEELPAGETIQSFDLSVPRESGAFDIITVRVSNRLLNYTDIFEGNTISVDGMIRSRRVKGVFHPKIQYVVFCQSVNEVECINLQKNNVCEIRGTLTQKPIHRNAKNSDRKLCELKVVTKHTRGKEYIIHAIAWGRYASYSKDLPKDTVVYMLGRLQRRGYYSTLEGARKFAYEVSVSTIRKEDK